MLAARALASTACQDETASTEEAKAALSEKAQSKAADIATIPGSTGYEIHAATDADALDSGTQAE